MASVTKQVAVKEARRLESLKKPKVYCVANYQDRVAGDIANGIYTGYAICQSRQEYEELLDSNQVGGIKTLWSSPAFKLDESGHTTF